jgi:hypothetical protein
MKQASRDQMTTTVAAESEGLLEASLAPSNPETVTPPYAATTAPSASAAPDPYDPAQFAASSTLGGSSGVTKELVTCPVRKPNKQEFVRVHPDANYSLCANILELKQEGETYLVMPGVAEALPGETKRVMLRLTVNRQGSVSFWPVPEPQLDGRDNHWNVSARSAAKRAEEAWVRIIANMSQGSYDLFVAPGDLADPAWPNKSLRDILEVAFGESFIIRDVAHPVIKRLMGRI